MYEWALGYESNGDLAEHDKGFISLPEFAQLTLGTINTDNKEIVYADEPGFTTVIFKRIDETTYAAGPIRRPI